MTVNKSTMSTPKAAPPSSQPAQKKPRHESDAMFAASMRSRKKTLKIILLEVLKKNPDIKGLAMRTKKLIIDNALMEFHRATDIYGDKRKEIAEMMLEQAKSFIIKTATVDSMEYDLENPKAAEPTMEMDGVEIVPNDDKNTEETNNENATRKTNKNNDNEKDKNNETTVEAVNTATNETEADDTTNDKATEKDKTTKRNETQPASILRRSGATSIQTPMFLSHVDLRATMVGITEKDRETELRETIDDFLDTVRSNDTTILLVPKMNPDGKAVRQISAKKYAKGKNDRGVRWNQSNSLPNIKQYTNDWVTKPSTWDTATIQISIKTSKKIDKVYYESAIPLLNRGIEMYPRRRHSRVSTLLTTVR